MKGESTNYVNAVRTGFDLTRATNYSFRITCDISAVSLYEMGRKRYIKSDRHRLNLCLDFMKRPINRTGSTQDESHTENSSAPCTAGGVYVYFTRMPGESCSRSLCLCDVFRALINSLDYYNS